MTRPSEIISILYSSTSDSEQKFDRREIFSEVCDVVESTNNVKIHIIDWTKNIAGGVGDNSGQDVINAAVDRQYDIYFGCLGVRYGAGTVEEFERAITSHIQHQDPKEILFGFDECPVNPYLVEPEFEQVRQFRNNIGTSDRYGRAILYFTFKNKKAFRKSALTHIDGAVKKICQRVLGGYRI